MTEAELLVEHALRVDRMWDIAQWWASVTFAVMIAVHLGAEKLNKVLVSILVLLYTVFTVLVVQTVRANIENILAVRSSLLELEELTILGAQITGEGGGGQLAAMLYAVLLLTYLSTIFYTIYCLLKGKIHEQPSAQQKST